MLARGMTWLIIAIPVLVNVAFFTLMERKVLGLAQRRKGPNKVSRGGVLQPFADAVKLFVKEVPVMTAGWSKVFFSAPLGALGLALLLWGLFSWPGREPESPFVLI